MSDYQLSSDDEVVIHFTTEDAPPYRVSGKLKAQSDEFIMLVGTVGEMINRDLFVPKVQIKMIERIAKRKDNA